jgi:large-conductance mechanosensitive channel
MMKKLTSMVLGAVAVVLPSISHAAASIDFPTTFANLSSQDIKTTIGNIIQIILGFLGILTVLFILYAGFLWMTSQGNEEQIGKAKGMISAAVIGLVLILAAYSIAGFVVSNLANAV